MFSEHGGPSAARCGKASGNRRTSRHGRAAARADGDRQPAPVPGRRVRVDVRLLHAGAASCRGGGLQPHRGGARRAQLSADPRALRAVRDHADRGAAARAAPHGRESRCGAGLGETQVEAGNRGARGIVEAEAGRAGGRAKAPGILEPRWRRRCLAPRRAAPGFSRRGIAVYRANLGPKLVLQPPVTHHARIAPLAPERYRIQLTVSRETHDKFRRAQALLRHAVPSGDAAEIFDRALTLLVERLERQRFAETARPRASHAGRERVRATFRRRCGGQCGGAMPDAARSSAPKDDAARQRFSSSTMSSRTPREERRAWRTSSCAAARTTCMRRGCSSGRTSFAKRVACSGMTRSRTSRLGLR